MYTDITKNKKRFFTIISVLSFLIHPFLATLAKALCYLWYKYASASDYKRSTQFWRDAIFGLWFRLYFIIVFVLSTENKNGYLLSLMEAYSIIISYWWSVTREIGNIAKIDTLKVAHRNYNSLGFLFIFLASLFLSFSSCSNII